jgi:hypothetical protein
LKAILGAFNVPGPKFVSAFIVCSAFALGVCLAAPSAAYAD